MSIKRTNVRVYDLRIQPKYATFCHIKKCAKNFLSKEIYLKVYFLK